MGSPRTSTQVVLAGALVLVALVLTGCSRGAESTTTSDTDTTTTTAPTASAPPTTTTTTEPREPADPGIVELARAAVLHEDDFDDRWQLDEPGGEHPLHDDSCSAVSGSPETRLRAGAAQQGPRMQLGDEPAAISSTSFAFRWQRSAVEWIEVVRSDQWARCTLERLADSDRFGSADLELSLDSRQIDGLGEQGFEAFAQFYGRDEDGNVDLVVNVMHYRVGGVVLEDVLERRADMDPADWAEVDHAHGTAVEAAWDRLNELR